MKSEGEARRSLGNQVLWTRVALVLCMCVALAFSVGAFLTQPHIVRWKRGDPLEVGKERVRAAAAELAHAWDPRDRAALRQRLAASEDLARFRLALRESLRERQRRNELVSSGLLECAAAVGGHEVRNEVAAIAASGSGASQVAAIEIAHRIAPWTREELAAFLANGDRAVRIGTLETLARNGGDMPHEALLSCLLSEDAAERQAALRAVPAKATQALRSELERLLVYGDAREGAQAIRALSRLACADEYEEQVTGCLATRPEEVRRAALEFLGERGRPPLDREAVWALAVDTLQSAGVRELALHCLEVTKSVDVEELAAHLHLFTPTQRLLAARCLLRAGDDKAFALLLDVLSGDETPALVESARRHLAWVCGAASSSTPAQFLAAFERTGRRVRSRHLPPHGLEF